MPSEVSGIYSGAFWLDRAYKSTFGGPRRAWLGRRHALVRAGHVVALAPGAAVVVLPRGFLQPAQNAAVAQRAP
jgi:hypothetical protein